MEQFRHWVKLQCTNRKNSTGESKSILFLKHAMLTCRWSIPSRLQLQVTSESSTGSPTITVTCLPILGNRAYFGITSPIPLWYKGNTTGALQTNWWSLSTLNMQRIILDDEVHGIINYTSVAHCYKKHHMQMLQMTFLYVQLSPGRLG